MVCIISLMKMKKIRMNNRMRVSPVSRQRAKRKRKIKKKEKNHLMRKSRRYSSSSRSKESKRGSQRRRTSRASFRNWRIWYMIKKKRIWMRLSTLCCQMMRLDMMLEAEIWSLRTLNSRVSTGTQLIFCRAITSTHLKTQTLVRSKSKMVATQLPKKASTRRCNQLTAICASSSRSSFLENK